MNKNEFLISIVIPAHNRPEYLLQAVQSIADQIYKNYEVVMIDDGSSPKIEPSDLKKILGSRINCYRHEVAKGVPKTKNAGIKMANGEVILLLDDDDLLLPDSLTAIHTSFLNHPDLDCLFLGVEAFGHYSDGPAKNREHALRKIIKESKPEELDDLYIFSDRLFNSLLTTVPIDFQRPAARKGFWNIVGGFNENCLFSESSWAIYASCVGKIALTKKTVTQWRIHGDNFGWPSDIEVKQVKKRQMDNSITAGEQLLQKFEEEKHQWQQREKLVKKHYSELLFSKAYSLFNTNRSEGLKALWQSFLIYPEIRHLKLSLKYLFSVLLQQHSS